MFNLRFILFFSFVSLGLTAQVRVEKKLSNTLDMSKWSSDGLSYANLGTQEQHSYFSVSYELNPKLFAEVQGYYDNHRISDVFDMSTRVKWYPTKKFYLVTGGGIQLQRTKGFGALPIMPSRMFNGVGFEPNTHITIEAIHDLNFNKNGAGLNGTPSLFILKGKYRF